ncbi:type I restriction enzyme, S subunit [Micromonospora echinospora]|uniref:Type I restriction enzyme, S subunit n=1 Tax=Micromonospora echinospora TaxID=1877 RepID=A0A1C4WDP2_MICEC|nr:restriction endonuclease subunit S [Micromonospora echinospora]SCE94300.1 type I restriction enzyme, S subunit [Micromonospora echinospora]
MTQAASGWRHVTVGEICEFKYGKSLPANARNPGDYPVYGSNGVVGSHDSYLTSGPTIVIGRKGSLGEVAFSPGPCWPIDTTYFVDSSATSEDLRWLSLRLAALGLTELNRAAAVPGLNREDAYRKTLLLPPLEEQRRLAEVLDRADELRAKRREALARLDDLTQSIFLDMFGDPVRNDRGWSRTLMSSLLERIHSGHSPQCLSRAAEGGEWGVLKLGAVTSCEFKPDENKALPPEVEPRKEHAVQSGDLLFSRKNTRELVGACALVRDTPTNLLLPDLIFRLELNPDAVINKVFLQQLLVYPSKRRQIQSLAGGSAGSMPNISKARLMAAEVEVPPLPLQRDFARRIDAIEDLKTVHRASLGELDALFASLQDRAFRGLL